MSCQIVKCEPVQYFFFNWLRNLFTTFSLEFHCQRHFSALWWLFCTEKFRRSGHKSCHWCKIAYWSNERDHFSQLSRIQTDMQGNFSSEEWRFVFLVVIYNIGWINMSHDKISMRSENLVTNKVSHFGFYFICTTFF